MHRLFTALAIPDELAAQLKLLQTNLPGAKWRFREHLHVTLSFHGQVSPEEADALADALDEARHPAMTLTLNGVGWFGRREPRAVYARIEATPDLEALARDCRKAARRIGLRPDDHPFLPHVTLAYCKDVPLEAVRAWSEAFQIARSEPYLVDQFHLFESFTSPGKMSRYQAQVDYGLGG